jgi:hypothetical protein
MFKLNVGTLGTTLGSFALALSCLQAKPAFAAPENSARIYYYSTASLTDEVGERIFSCTQPFITTIGEVTVYTRIEDPQVCGDPGNPAYIGSLSDLTPNADNPDSIPNDELDLLTKE